SQPKKHRNPSQQTETGNDLTRLHPSLRTKFVPLPKAGEALTDEQLTAVFSGDLDALRDVARLAGLIPQE
ncbi:MAG: hypothetical protein K8I60_04455, partial [Anaerolineae bacterium]|nr:hypothetical protein [Anaerolineae bacterium]